MINTRLNKKSVVAIVSTLLCTGILSTSTFSIYAANHNMNQSNDRQQIQQETMNFTNNSAEASYVSQFMNAEINHKMFAAAIENTDFSYNILTDGTIEITGYQGTDSNIVIPAEIAGYKVSTIATHAFMYNKDIKNVRISEGIKGLGDEVFFGADNLEYIYLPSTLGISESGSFRGMGGKFNNNKSLLGIYVDDNNPVICDVDGILYSKDMKMILKYPEAATQKQFVLPDTITEIGSDSICYNPYLEKVVMPNSVTYIGYWAFNCDSSLKDVNISTSCEIIGQFAFNSTAITDIYIPASVTGVMSTALSAPTLKNITVSPENKNLYTDDAGCLYDGTTLIVYPYANERTSYKVLAGTEMICQEAFMYAKHLEEIELADSITNIDNYAFMDCNNLKKINIPLKLTSYTDNAFSNVNNLTLYGYDNTNAKNIYNDILKRGRNATYVSKGAAHIVNFVGGLTYKTFGLNEIERPTNKEEDICAYKYYLNYGTELQSEITTWPLQINSDIEITAVKKINVLSVTLSQNDIRIGMGDSYQLSAWVYPTDVFDSGIRYTSDNELVAKVSQSGYIEAVGEGTAVVTAVSTANSKASKTCTVTVTPASYDNQMNVYNGIDYSAVYNKNYYYANNPDVAKAFGNDSQKLIWHFVTYGMAEGRCAKNDFNAVKYMYGLLNDDLRAAYGGDMVKYYEHYMNFGQYEGRSVSDWDSVFDAEYYLTANPDVKENIISRYTADGNLKGWALWHYCEYGANEGRHANVDFGVLNYEAANPDVYQAYGSDLKAATIHYLQFGAGRNTKTNLDIYSIPQTRPDVAATFGINNPVVWVGWYINYGQFESSSEN